MLYSKPVFEQKICASALLEEKTHSLPRPLVFTNGCFDILHRGHVTYLAQARALGASLVVAVNNDDSIRRLDKGADRPINNEADRLAILASLESVSLVVLFEEDTPAALIQRILPDILVKGGDWTVDQIVGSEFVRARGGTVHSIPFIFDTSTTQLITKIRSRKTQ